MMIFCKSCSNKFDRKHDNFIYERGVCYEHMLWPIVLSTLFSISFASTMNSITPFCTRAVRKRWSGHIIRLNGFKEIIDKFPSMNSTQIDFRLTTTMCLYHRGEQYNICHAYFVSSSLCVHSKPIVTN